MKLSRSGMANAFTLVELLMVCAVILLLALILIPISVRQQEVRKQKQCTHNLMEIGLAFRIWATDSRDEIPTARSTNQGGTLEYFGVAGSTYLHFRTISNELSTPQALTCPADVRRVARNFLQLSNENLSYFVGAGVEQEMADAILGGDRNVITNGHTITNGLLVLSTNAPGAWDDKIHRSKGNLMMPDGSVRRLDNAGFTRALRFAETNYGPQRLSVPW